MAYNTFISYKYSEAKDLRDRIVDSLGVDSKYYKGETSESPDLSDRKTEYIRENLKDLIYLTSVTIVIISPNMTQSNWIDWEIEYSLKQIKRNDRTSGTNGVLGIVMKYNNDYSWLRSSTFRSDGHTVISTDTSYLYDIINKNRINENPVKYLCEDCKSIDALKGSYISLIEEEKFLKNPNKYIENAYNKSKNTSNYDLRRKI
ncbi:TIR domain-containing protein [Staphylococcus aureus]